MSVGNILTTLSRPRRNPKRGRRADRALRYGFHQFDRLEERTLLSTIMQTATYGPLSQPIPSFPGDGTLSPAINQFNTQGGSLVLESVTIVGSSQLVATLSGSITNDSRSASLTYYADVTNATTSFSGPGISTVSNSISPLLTFGTPGSPMTIAAGTTLNINGGTPITETLTASTGTVVLTSPSDLSQFEGTGTLATPYSMTGSATSNAVYGGGSTDYTQNTTFTTDGKATVTVTYDYVAATKLVTNPGPTGIITLPTTTTRVTLNDSATLSNAYFPTGTITFTLYNPSNTLVYTDVVPLPLPANASTATVTTATGNNPGGYTLPTTTTVTGTYQWDASYSGDGNNSPTSDNNNTNEQVQVVPPHAPTIRTTPGGTVVAGSGVAMTDSATITTAYFPTGTVTFDLYAPGVTASNYATSTPVYTDVVTLTGSASPVTVSASYKPPANAPTGTYNWVAIYSSGNGNNTGVSSIFGAEPETVSRRRPCPCPCGQPVVSPWE